MKDCKLQLEIKLKNDKIIKYGSGTLSNFFILNVKFLDKHELFQSTLIDNRFTTFKSKNGFTIYSIFDNPYGGLLENGIIIPKMDKLGFELSKTFTSDDDRYNYLKNMYIALEDWGNNWLGFFDYSCSTNIYMNGDKWSVITKVNESNHYVSPQKDEYFPNYYY